MKKIEIGAASSVYRGEKRYIQGSDRENLQESDHLEDGGVDETRILKWVLKELDGGGGRGCGHVTCCCEHSKCLNT